jgi:hypothetical protein
LLPSPRLLLRALLRYPVLLGALLRLRLSALLLLLLLDALLLLLRYRLHALLRVLLCTLWLLLHRRLHRLRLLGPLLLRLRPLGPLLLDLRLLRPLRPLLLDLRLLGSPFGTLLNLRLRLLARLLRRSLLRTFRMLLLLGSSSSLLSLFVILVLRIHRQHRSHTQEDGGGTRYGQSHDNHSYGRIYSHVNGHAPLNGPGAAGMAYAVHTPHNMFLRCSPRLTPSLCYFRGAWRLLMTATLGLIFIGLSSAQQGDPTSWQSKLAFHASTAYSPSSLAATAAYTGFLQGIDFPREWGQGTASYGKRLGSELAYTGVRNTMSLALDTTLHEDPRYYRSTATGFWHRMGHAFRGTVLTHTDAGGETFAWWRWGSAYGATYLSNQWYPDRVNTVKLDLTEGTTQMGFDFLANVGSEFWPDIKKKVFRRKP